MPAKRQHKTKNSLVQPLQSFINNSQFTSTMTFEWQTQYRSITQPAPLNILVTIATIITPAALIHSLMMR